MPFWYTARSVDAAGTEFELDLKYEMIKPIGQGAYGIVISADDHESHSKVCFLGFIWPPTED